MSRKRLGAGGRHRRRSWLRRRWLLLAGALGIGAAALRRSRTAREGDDLGPGGGDSADHAARAGGRAKAAPRLIAAVAARLTPVAKRALEVAGGTATTVRRRLRRQESVGDSPATDESVAVEASAEQEPAIAPGAAGEDAKPAAKATSSRSDGRSRARKPDAGTHQTSTAEAGTGEAGTEDASAQQE